MGVSVDTNIHTSVLLHELVESIHISSDSQNIIADMTLGYGGHALEVIKRLHDGDIFIGFDTDDRNLALAKKRLGEHIPDGVQVHFVHSNFEFVKDELSKLGIQSLTAIYYDLGVSSLHFDEGERGFSFRSDGPLDMRLDIQLSKTAADVVNYYEEKDLFTLLREYGEEPHARKIAARLIQARKKKKFVTTYDLKNFLDSEINTHIKTKMRAFQALRIEVNNELGVLKNSLIQAIKLLSSRGRILVISFHSLEDRIVKQSFKKETRDCICRDIVCTCKHTKSLKLLHKKPITPSQEEQKQNPRSRSAKMRIAEKI